MISNATNVLGDFVLKIVIGNIVPCDIILVLEA